MRKLCFTKINLCYICLFGLFFSFSVANQSENKNAISKNDTYEKGIALKNSLGFIKNKATTSHLNSKMNFQNSSDTKFANDDLQSILDNKDFCSLARSNFLDKYDLDDLLEVLFHHADTSNFESQILVRALSSKSKEEALSLLDQTNSRGGYFL